MSTAEITFSIGELAAERKQEARKIFLALVGALVIHLIVGSVLAIVGSAQPTPMVEEDKPMEMTIVDTSPVVPVVPKNPPFIEPDESRQSAEAPKEKTFESNANSIAASQLPATGEAPLPSQEGKDRPGLDLENQQYTLAHQGAPAQAAIPEKSVAPSQSSTPAPTASPPLQVSTPAPTAAPDQFAMLTKRPTPPPQPETATPPPKPQTSVAPQPSSVYRPERQATRLSGNISNRGIAAVNALGTPLGRYQKIVTDSIGSRWYAYTQSKIDLITIGTLRVHFVVDRNGKIQNLRILGNTSNETFANICLQSILDANLPPIPDDVAASLPPEGLDCDGISFTLYPN
jgi:hypothetical protein